MTRAFVYILKCGDNTLYTGYTTNIYRRLKAHKTGKGAKYTRGRSPLKIIYYESFSEKVFAQKREYAIKKLSRPNKVLLVKDLKLTLIEDLVDWRSHEK